LAQSLLLLNKREGGIMMTWGQLARNIRVRLYPAVALASTSVVALAGLGLALGQIELVSPQAEFFPEELDVQAVEQNQDRIAQAKSPTIATDESAIANPAITQTKPTASATAAKPNPADVAARLGSLRVSNQTEHPIRVALLTRMPKSKAQSAKAGDAAAYAPPAHWDFAPGEGSNRGLLLSLPNVNLKIKRGDVLVAFAQDGSRRYWGPYVVGETGTPSWNGQTAEWQLVLQPKN
jgi:hypothetical protein